MIFNFVRKSLRYQREFTFNLLLIYILSVNYVGKECQVRFINARNLSDEILLCLLMRGVDYKLLLSY